jgi:hypothetical protein
MASRLHRTTVAAAYHLSLLAGILLMPVALVARQVGVPLPLDRVVRRLHHAYETTEAEPR